MASSSCHPLLEIPDDLVAEPPSRYSIIAPQHARSVFWLTGADTHPPSPSNSQQQTTPVDVETAVLQGRVYLLDQRVLPHGGQQFVECTTTQQVAEGIRSMVVRGAPAIGATGAYGMVIAAAEIIKENAQVDMPTFIQTLKQSKEVLDDARPTAVNLTWATDRMLNIATEMSNIEGCQLKTIAKQLLNEAHALFVQDVNCNLRMAQFGASLIPQGARLVHHCNTGFLATVDVGTALGVIFESHKTGKNVHVWVDETRPRLQGARLTAYELQMAGVSMSLIADNASGLLMLQGKVDAVIFGADRVAANGDVANKIGTYKLAVCAKANNIPVYATVPTSTIDLATKRGFDIPIEERHASEVTHVGETNTAPNGVQVYNPAFDITPAEFITGIITEQGVCYPPFGESLAKAKQAAESQVEEEWLKSMSRAKASATRTQQ
eukprot:gb/GECG01006674.1/.p1 GENE.gb/GECG01006674.1/~~gb/GECG01006674.1/.p1  ORF type:complete len:436 (+),score=52.25 gb/GECG01006674.1/:1-1308(+)